MTAVYCIIICTEGWQDRWHCGSYMHIGEPYALTCP